MKKKNDIILDKLVNVNKLFLLLVNDSVKRQVVFFPVFFVVVFYFEKLSKLKQKRKNQKYGV